MLAGRSLSAVRGKEPGVEGSIKDFMASKRRIIRERVLQALYAHELSHNPVAAIIETVLEDLKKDPATFDFARSLVQRVIDAEDELDTHFVTFLHEFLGAGETDFFVTFRNA